MSRSAIVATRLAIFLETVIRNKQTGKVRVMQREDKQDKTKKNKGKESAISAENPGT